MESRRRSLGNPLMPPSLPTRDQGELDLHRRLLGQGTSWLFGISRSPSMSRCWLIYGLATRARFRTPKQFAAGVERIAERFGLGQNDPSQDDSPRSGRDADAVGRSDIDGSAGPQAGGSCVNVPVWACAWQATSRNASAMMRLASLPRPGDGDSNGVRRHDRAKARTDAGGGADLAASPRARHGRRGRSPVVRPPGGMGRLRRDLRRCRRSAE